MLMRALADADVFIQNVSPGKLERLRIEPERLRKMFPRLIYCAISGFGRGATTEIPQIDEGFASPHQSNLEVKRRDFVTAECPHGKLSATLATVYRDGTETHDESIRACTR